jgi:uncharacterized protein
LPAESLRIIFDTNIWISFAIGKRLEYLAQILLNSPIKVYVSTELIGEFLEVVQRPKLKKFISNQRMIDTVNIMRLDATLTVIKSRVKHSRDAKDDYLLALAKDVRADYLITGDKDLLVIEQYLRTKIITFNEFANLINAFSTSSN